MKLNINLEEGMEGSPAMPMSKDMKHFPEFTFREKQAPKFPDEGTMTIRYKKVRTSMDKKSDKPYSCTLEIREIVSASGSSKDSEDAEPAKGGYKEAEDALDKLALEKSKSKTKTDGEGY